MRTLHRTEAALQSFFANQQYPPFNGLQPALVENSLAPVENQIKPDAHATSILDSILGNGFLFAVPTHRRTLEVRMSRRLAYRWRYHVKKNIKICDVCGHYKEAHTICGNCYAKVKLETEAIKEAIQEKLKLDPVDREVVVVYENEILDENLVPGTRIVEIKKESPPWFSRNLLTKTREGETETALDPQKR